VNRTGGTLHTWETRDAPRLYAVRHALREAHAAAVNLRAARNTASTLEWRVPLADAAHLQRVVRALWSATGGRAVDHAADHTAARGSPAVGMAWTPGAWHHEQRSTYALYDGRRVQQTTTLAPPTAAHLGAAAAACRVPRLKQTLQHAAQVLRACSAPVDALHAQQSLLTWLLAHPDAAQEVLACTPSAKTPSAARPAPPRQHVYMPVRTRVEERVVAPHAGNDVLRHVYADCGVQAHHVVTRAVDAAAVPAIVLPTRATLVQRLAVHAAWDGAALRRWSVSVERCARGDSMHAADAALREERCTYAVVVRLKVGAAAEPSAHLVQMALRVMQHATNLARRTSNSDVA